MGFFKSLFSPAPNKYAQHPDVLDQMARDMARWAMEQLRDDTIKGEEMETWVKLTCSWALVLDNKPEAHTRSLGRYTGYSMQFNNYGMDNVPTDDADAFLDAFCPHLEKHCKAIVNRYFPGEIVLVSKTLYESKHYRDDDYDLISAIRIYVPSYTTSTTTSTYKSW